MLKRMVLSFAFIAAVGAAGLGMGSKALAWDDCGSGYRAAYYPTYPAYYGYAPSYGYAPRVVSYRAPIVVRDYDYRDYDHHRHHHDYDHNRISFSFGF